MADEPTRPNDPVLAVGVAPDLRRLRHRSLMAAGLAGVIALGGAVHLARGLPAGADLGALPPVPIAQMRSDTNVATRGEVVEIFGNKLILQDQSGRALVDLGPRGEDDPGLVHKGERLLVRGRFDRGVVHAAMLDGSGGPRILLGPPPRLPPPPAATPRP